MNYLRLTASGKDLRFDMSNSRDISIPLHFNQPQPNHFDAEMAHQKPMHGDTFVGDTRQGGSCNVSVITLTPHCNGTHTECLSHVTRQGPHIRDIAPTELQIAALVTITPTNAVKSVDRYDPNPDKSDQIITEYSLTSALAPFMELKPSALIVRTKPNTDEKLTRDYEKNPPPYFSLNAIEYLVESRIDHLLVDMPSIDRSHDQGKLCCHRIFWGLPPDSVDDLEASRPWTTITEMIFAHNEIRDGIYLLNLQVPPFSGDAAPCRPILFELEN